MLSFRYFKFGSSDDEEILRISKQLNDYFSSVIAAHQKTFDPGDLRDYIDVYLEEINQAADSGLSSVVNVKNLQASIIQVCIMYISRIQPIILKA